MACGGWEGSVDSSQLEARLRAGLEADRRYTAENAAKLRAIHSAPTYDEFRQLVLGEEKGCFHMCDTNSRKMDIHPSTYM